MSEQRSTLFRREALPFDEAALTQAQREALDRAAAMLDDACSAPGPAARDEGHPAPPRFLAAIGEERPSRVLLIHGPRGSGKSSLLLTLLQRYVRAFASRGGDVVVPLRVLDMDTLPADRNLMLEICACLDPVVHDVLGEGRASPPWDQELGRGPSLEQAWRDFQYAATLAEKGALEGRRAKLDPDAFVAEWSEAVLQRASLEGAFTTFVDLLVKAFFERYRARPLFVISLDDADLASTHVLPTLRLVRRLYHRRVCFVVTGSLVTFEMMLKNDLRGSVARLDVARDAELRDLERAYVKQVLSKVFPPGQRLPLPELPLDDRRRLLREALERIGAPESARGVSLAKLFELVPQLAELLPGNLRDLVSLQRQLPEGEHAWPRALALLTLEDLDERPLRDDADARERMAFERLRAPTHVFQASGPDVVVRGVGPGFLRLALSPNDREASLGARSPNAEGAPLAGRDVARLLAWQECEARLEPLLRSGLPPFVCTGWAEGLVEWPRPTWLAPSAWFALWHQLRLVESLRETQVEAGPVVREYLVVLAARSALWDEGAPDRSPARGELMGSPSWEAVEAALLPVARSRTYLLQDWATTGVGLLACPEIGLAEDDGNHLLELAFKLSSDGGEAFRERLLAARDKLQADSGLVRPDSSYWRERVGPASVDRRKLQDELLSRLGEFATVAAEPHRQSSSRGLTRYFTERRFGSLRKQWATQEAWLSDMKELGRQVGDAELALRALWERVRRDDPALEECPNPLRPTALAVRYEALVRAGSVWQVRSDGRWEEFGEARVARGEAGWTTGRGLRTELGQVAFELAWDFAHDRVDRDATANDESALGLVWWPLVAGRGEGPRVPWPAIRWPAMLDHEIVLIQWDDLIVRLRQALSRGVGMPAVDALAFHFLQAEHAVAEERTEHAQLQTVAPSPTDWGDLFDRMRGHIEKHQDSARWRVFCRGLRRMALLAAPESGLSGEACEAILAGLVDDSRWKGLPVLNLGAEREARALHVHGTPEAAADALRRWDASAPGHPWGKRFPREA